MKGGSICNLLLLPWYEIIFSTHIILDIWFPIEPCGTTSKKKKKDYFTLTYMSLLLTSKSFAYIWSLFPQVIYHHVTLYEAIYTVAYIFFHIASGSTSILHFVLLSAESGAWIQAWKDKLQYLHVPKITAASNQQGFVCCWGHLGYLVVQFHQGKARGEKNEQATYVFFFSWVAPRTDLERRLFGVLLAFKKRQTRKLTVMLFHGASQLEISPACFPWRQKAEQ